jgi:AAA+ superfamily predicted ATPase
VKVFNLKTGISNLVHIRNLQKYEYRKDSIDKLIIPSGAKRVVAALAQQATKTTATDIVEGKGAATIIAAMGSPGLGKTSLAEVASEQCERPLYRLEATDLGTNPEQIEEALSEAFKLAARFDAMLLLDECNAYVHVRRGTDHKQQEIVAVFLRKLEYFRGLLMLTTNMTAAMGGAAYADFDIDPAILSRCSAVITFELPTIKQAFSIWKVQAEQLGVLQHISDEEFKLLAKTYNLSGRSIRNLLRLAISLCEYDKNDSFKSEYIADAYEYSSRASSSLEGLRVDPSN